MTAVWRDVVVTDDSLVQCVAELRRSLGDSEHRIIQTEPKRGYRLRALDEGAAVAAPARSALESEIPQVRFATAPDGVRIAFAVSGDGPPVVRAGRWMSHVELEWNCLTEIPLLREFSRRFTFLRHDMRGQGLSDRGVAPRGPRTRARDLLAAIDAAGFDRFTLLGFGLIGVAAATQFARDIPERVERVILVTPQARGAMVRGDQSPPADMFNAWVRVLKGSWDSETEATARQMMAGRHYPDATKPQLDSYNELLRRACSAEGIVEVTMADSYLEMTDRLGWICWPTLVLHSAATLMAPLEEGRLVAAGIPGARFKTFNSRSYLPLPEEPGFDELLRSIDEFMSEPVATRAPRAGPGTLRSVRGGTR